MNKLLPDGLKTRNHFLFNISSENGQKVDIFYVALMDAPGTKILFIYDIETS